MSDVDRVTALERRLTAAERRADEIHAQLDALVRRGIEERAGLAYRINQLETAQANLRERLRTELAGNEGSHSALAEAIHILSDRVRAIEQGEQRLGGQWETCSKCYHPKHDGRVCRWQYQKSVAELGVCSCAG